jgi:trehalose-6-phosphatase
MLANSLVKAVKGQKTVEVKLVWANKGQMYSRLLVPDHKPDFIMAAGDDATDEDLFAQLPQSAWTIHVGRNRSRARYYVSDPKEMLAMLERLNQASHATENRGAHDMKYWQEERSGEIELLEGMSEQKKSTQSQRVTAGEIFT